MADPAWTAEEQEDLDLAQEQTLGALSPSPLIVDPEKTGLETAGVAADLNNEPLEGTSGAAISETMVVSPATLVETSKEAAELSEASLNNMDAEKGALGDEIDPQKLTEYPEGGLQGWISVLIPWCCVGSLIGVGINLWGLFVDYWKTNESFGPDVSLFWLSFPSSVAAGISVIVAPFAGRFAERGHFRQVGMVGAVLFLLGYAVSGFAKAPWQLLLSIGVLFGTGLACLFQTAIVLPSHYFLKRRGLAVGLAITGTGTFGFAFGPLISLVLTNLGWQWAMRIIGLGLGSLTLFMSFFMRPRVFADLEGKFFDFRHLKRIEFWPFAIVQSFEGLWYYSLYYYLPVYGTYVGCSPSQSAMLVSILMIAGLLGRVTLGYTFDKLGHLNGFVSSYLVAILAVFLIWPFATSFAALAAFAVFTGINAGGYVAMMLTCFADTMGAEDLATSSAMMFFFGIVSQFLGAPLCGIIIDANTTVLADGTKVTNWLPLIMFTGASMVPGLVALIWLRFRQAKWKWLAIV